jgi:hypothetical protein
VRDRDVAYWHMALPKWLRKSRRYLFDFVTKRNQLAGHVMSGHANLDPDQARRHVHESCGNPVPSNFFTQNDCALLIQVNHMQRVLAGIDPNGADG